MSLQSRRNSLFKSSISIKSIGDSVQKFSKSLRGARRNADQAIKTIRQKNIFWYYFSHMAKLLLNFEQSSYKTGMPMKIMNEKLCLL